MPTVDLGPEVAAELRHATPVDETGKWAVLNGGDLVAVELRSADGDSVPVVTAPDNLAEILRGLGALCGKAAMAQSGGDTSRTTLGFVTHSMTTRLDRTNGAVLLAFASDDIEYATALSPDLVRRVRDALSKVLGE